MITSRVKGGPDAIGAGPAGAIVLFMAGVRSVCRVGGRYLSTESDKRDRFGNGLEFGRNKL
jgi:hypothetical protein